MCAADLIWSQVFRKFPNLKIALSEGGIGWIPYFLDRIDYHVPAPQGVDAPGLRRQAAEPGVPRAHHHVLHRRPDRHQADRRRRPRHGHVGVRLPALRLAWPHAPEVFMKSIGDLSDDKINKITHENAIREFQFDPFAHRPEGAVHRRCAAGRVSRRRRGDAQPASEEVEHRHLVVREHGVEGAPAGLTAARGREARSVVSRP